MAATATAESEQADDDARTVCAIRLLAAMLVNILHEGLGHAATALLTGAKSGVIDHRRMVQ